eukprot:scaffold5158_cov153-Amphora_coffeaeformis.AAC.10
MLCNWGIGTNILRVPLLNADNPNPNGPYELCYGSMRWFTTTPPRCHFHDDEMLMRLITTTLLTTTTTLLFGSSSSLILPRLSYPALHHCRAASFVPVPRSFPRPTATMTTSNPASREELRRLRLAAMFGKRDKDDENQEHPPLKKAKLDKQAIIDLLDADSSSDEEDTKEAAAVVVKPKACAKKGQKSAVQVVDLLLDDSSNDGEPKAAASKKRGKAATQRAAKKAEVAPAKKSSEPSELSSGSVDDISFQVASYNLWFGTQRNGYPHAQARMQAVADLLLEVNTKDGSPLYFMAFQEVVHELDKSLFPLIESAGYQMIRQPLGNPMFDPYGVALAVHASVTVLDGGWNPYRLTQMDRGFVYARCRLPNGLTCLVTSTHLESWAGKEMNGSVARVQQLNAMEDYCNRHIESKRADLAVMMGDLNWDDTSRNPTDPVLDDVLSSVEWKDAWLETNHLRKTADARKGYTYDPKLNPMMGGNLRRRVVVSREEEGIENSTI